MAATEIDLARRLSTDVLIRSGGCSALVDPVEVGGVDAGAGSVVVETVEVGGVDAGADSVAGGTGTLAVL